MSREGIEPSTRRLRDAVNDPNSGGFLGISVIRCAEHGKSRQIDATQAQPQQVTTSGSLNKPVPPASVPTNERHPYCPESVRSRRTYPSNATNRARSPGGSWRAALKTGAGRRVMNATGSNPQPGGLESGGGKGSRQRDRALSLPAWSSPERCGLASAFGRSPFQPGIDSFDAGHAAADAFGSIEVVVPG